MFFLAAIFVLQNNSFKVRGTLTEVKLNASHFYHLRVLTWQFDF